MLYLTCTTITNIDLAHYGVSRAKDWVSVKCGTRSSILSAVNRHALKEIISQTDFVFKMYFLRQND